LVTARDYSGALQTRQTFVRTELTAVGLTLKLRPSAITSKRSEIL